MTVKMNITKLRIKTVNKNHTKFYSHSKSLKHESFCLFPDTGRQISYVHVPYFVIFVQREYPLYSRITYNCRYNAIRIYAF